MSRPRTFQKLWATATSIGPKRSQTFFRLTCNVQSTDHENNTPWKSFDNEKKAVWDIFFPGVQRLLCVFEMVSDGFGHVWQMCFDLEPCYFLRLLVSNCMQNLHDKGIAESLSFFMKNETLPVWEHPFWSLLTKLETSRENLSPNHSNLWKVNPGRNSLSGCVPPFGGERHFLMSMERYLAGFGQKESQKNRILSDIHHDQSAFSMGTCLNLPFKMKLIEGGRTWPKFRKIKCAKPLRPLEA